MVMTRIPNVSNRVLVVIMAFEVVVSGLLVWLGVTTLQTANQASRLAGQLNRTAESQYQACLQANQERASQRALWPAILATAVPHPTPTETAVLGRFLVVVDNAFPPETCHNQSS